MGEQNKTEDDGHRVRVVMARKVAGRWLQSRLRSEYRFSFYCESKQTRIPDLLRSFRDGKIRLASVSPLPDLGIEDNGNSVAVWSSDRQALLTLQSWLEKRGLETTGIW